MVPNARPHELFDGLDWLNTAPGPGRHTIHRGGGASEIELPLEEPILQQPIDKPGVKDIAGASGIDHWNAISGNVM
jgi:hypothetical protein